MENNLFQIMRHHASSSVPALAVAIAWMALLCQPLNAQDDQVYSDPPPDSNLWDNETENWDSSALWISGNNAIFGGVGGTVLINDTILVHNITFNSSGYSLVPDPLLPGGNLSLHGDGSIISVGADHTATISAVITAGPLIKSGTGTLVLAGTKDFDGLTIEEGVLAVSSNTSLGGAGGTSGAVTLDGGTLKMTLPGSTVTNTHVITVGANGGTIHIAKPTSGTPTYIMGAAGNLTGSGTLTVQGDGTLGVAGANSVLVLNSANAGFTGDLVIQDGGILEYANNDGISNSSEVTVNANGMLSLANATMSRAVTLNEGGYLGFQNNNNGRFSGPITLNGDAFVRLQNWYNQNVVTGSINSTITGAHRLTLDSGSNLGTGGTLVLDGFDAKASDADLILNGASLAINSNSGTGVASVTRANNLTINSGNLTVNGTAGQNTNDVFGTLNLGGGSTTTSVGVLQGFSTWTLTPNAATNTALTFTNMGTRTAGSWVALISAATLGGTPGANTANIYFTNGLSGANLVGGGGAIGSGTESIIPWLRAKAAGDNNLNTQFYTYDATRGVVAVGAVNVDVNSASPTQNVFDLSGSTLNDSKTINSLIAGGTVDTAGHTLTVTSGAIIADTNLTFNNGTLNFGSAEAQLSSRNARALAINSAISGSGGLTYVGFRVNSDPTLILGGANTYTGVTNFYGYGGNTNIRLTHSLALQNTTLNHVANRGYTLTFGNGGTSGQTAYTFGGLSGNANINLNNNNTTVGAVALTVGGNNEDTIYGGVISSTVSGGSVTKTGTGTTEFTGSNTYDGGTTVSQGRLLANNTSGSATGTGNINVAQGAIFGGTGAAGGPSSVNTINGILQMGNNSVASVTAADFSLTGSTTMTATSVMQFDLFSNKGGTGNVAGEDNDSIEIIGSFNIADGASVEINSFVTDPTDLDGWAVGDTWSLIDWSLTTSSDIGDNLNFSSNIDAILAANGLAWDYSNLFDTDFLNNELAGNLLLTVVPEPGRMLLLLGGLVFAICRRRR